MVLVFSKHLEIRYYTEAASFCKANEENRFFKLKWFAFIFPPKDVGSLILFESEMLQPGKSYLDKWTGSGTSQTPTLTLLYQIPNHQGYKQEQDWALVVFVEREMPCWEF